MQPPHATWDTAWNSSPAKLGAGENPGDPWNPSKATSEGPVPGLQGHEVKNRNKGQTELDAVTTPSPSERDSLRLKGAAQNPALCTRRQQNAGSTRTAHTFQETVTIYIWSYEEAGTCDQSKEKTVNGNKLIDDPNVALAEKDFKPDG